MPLSPITLVDRFLHGPLIRPARIQPALPLQGITLLAVEDSRFAADTLRLLCQRSGVRLRRAETLAAARAHLRVYRPDVMLVDLGLPDGLGDNLIRELASHPKAPITLGISGDPEARTQMLAAGARGFVAKPFPALASFQQMILQHLPDRADRAPIKPAETSVTPDPLALRDDLERAMALMDANPGPKQYRYLQGFVTSLANSFGDAALAAAASQLGDHGGADRLQNLLNARLAKIGTAMIAGAD